MAPDLCDVTQRCKHCEEENGSDHQPLEARITIDDKAGTHDGCDKRIRPLAMLGMQLGINVVHNCLDDAGRRRPRWRRCHSNPMERNSDRLYLRICRLLLQVRLPWRNQGCTTHNQGSKKAYGPKHLVDPGKAPSK